MTQPTKDKLADALLDIGLMDMSIKARWGYYDDFLSPLATPCIQLVQDLFRVGTPAAMELRQRAMDGEFDGTSEEAEAWAKSREGRDAISRLSTG